MSDISGSKASPGAAKASPPIGYDPGREAKWELVRQVNWGTRFPRSNEVFYFSRKPTKEECVRVLREHGHQSACVEWFEPRNSGLLKIQPAEPRRIEF